MEAVNLAVVLGECSSPAQTQALPSGQTLVQLQVTARAATTTSVPVVAIDPPRWVAALDTGDPVLVIGTVRRRFFRAAGTTASRVEVVADTGARGGDRRRLRALRRRIDATLTPLDP